MRYLSIIFLSFGLYKMALQQPDDPCPHLPLAGTPPDPDDPVANAPDPGPGMTWTQFPWHDSFISDPTWYDGVGRDMIVRKRIFMLESEEEQTAETLKVLEVFPDRGLYILFKAAVRGKPHIIKALLDRGVKTHPVVEDGDDESLMPLHAAAFQGHVDCVRVLAEQSSIDPDLFDVHSTPLQRSALAGHADVVRYLLGTGRVDIRREFEYDGRTRHPLEWMVRGGNTETADVLIDAWVSGLSSDALPSSVPDVVIETAAREGNVAIFTRLLKIRGLLPEDADTKDKVPSLGDNEKLLVKAYQLAASWAKLELMQFLLGTFPQVAGGAEAQLDETKKCLGNGLEQAVEDKNIATFDFLASDLFGHDHQQPDAQVAFRHCLYKAVFTGSVPLVKHLVEKYNIDLNDGSLNPQKITPIGVAAARSDAALVQYLLEEAPIKPDLTLGAGDTNIRPLWYAVREKSVPVARLLLQHGAPVSVVPTQETQDGTPSFLRIAACLDPERQVRVYLDQKEWEEAPQGEIRAFLSLDEESRELRDTILSSEATTYI